MAGLWENWTNPETNEEIISQVSGIPTKSLCYKRIGIRIFKPEKSEIRHLKPPANILFPIGMYGGNQRNIQRA